MSLTLAPQQEEATASPSKPRWHKRLWQHFAGDDPIAAFATAGSYALVIGLVAVVFNLAAALVVTGLVATFHALRFGSRRWPQAVGMVASILALQAAVVTFSLLLTPLFALSDSYELAGAFLIAPLVTALAAKVAPHRGVHLGWTVALSHLPMWAGLMASPWFPASVSWLACLSTVLGLLVVVMRSRFAQSTPSTERGRVKRRFAKAVSVGFIGILSASMLTLATSNNEAKAFDMTFGLGDKMLCGVVSPSLSPQPVGTGPEGFLANGNLAGLTPKDGESTLMNVEMEEFDGGQGLSNYTLFEVAGLRGLSYVNWTKDKKGENTNCAFQPWVSVTIGGFVNGLGLLGLQTVIALKEFSQVKNPFEPFYTSFTPAVTMMANVMFGLCGTAYVIGLMLFAARMIKGGNNLQRAARNATGAMMTTFIAAIAYGGLSAGAAWNAPQGNGFYTVMSWLDKTAGTINAGISNEVLGSIDSGREAMCIKPSGGSAIQDGQRYSSCLLAEAMAYEPWALATFGPEGKTPIEPEEGSVPAEESQANEDALEDEGSATPLPCYNDYQDCNDLRTYLISQMGGPDITERMQKCLDNNQYDSEADEEENQAAMVACDPYTAVANDLFAKANSGNGSLLSAYRAQGSGSNHFTQAFVSLISTSTVGVGVAIFATATVVFHARLLMLFFMGPITLTMASFKGVEHATKWLSNLVQTVVVRVIYGIMTTIIIFTVAQISAMDMDAGYRLLMLGLILFIAFKMVREADQMSQFGGADGSSRSSTFGGVLAGNLASRATGSVLRSGKSAVVGGSKLAAAGAGLGAYHGARIGSRPARNAHADFKAKQAGRRVEKQRYQQETGDGSHYAMRQQDRALERGDMAATASGGRIMDRQQAEQSAAARQAAASQRQGGAAPMGGTSGSSGDNAGSSAVAGAAGAAAGAAAASAGGSAPSAKGSRPTSGAATPSRSANRPSSANISRTRDLPRRAAGATRSAFSDPNGRSRQITQSREELFQQMKREENAKRNEAGEDVLSIRERRQMRKQVNQATPVQVVESLRGLTQEERLARLGNAEQETRTSPSRKATAQEKADGMTAQQQQDQRRASRSRTRTRKRRR